MGLLVGGADEDPAAGVEAQEPLKVIYSETKSCPSKPLQPFGDRVKGPSNIPEREVRGSGSAHMLEVVQDLKDGRVCTMLCRACCVPWQLCHR